MTSKKTQRQKQKELAKKGITIRSCLMEGKVPWPKSWDLPSCSHVQALTPAVRSKAEEVWPFMELLKIHSWDSFDDFLALLDQKGCLPECEVYWWEMVVLTILDVTLLVRWGEYRNILLLPNLEERKKAVEHRMIPRMWLLKIEDIEPIFEPAFKHPFFELLVKAVSTTLGGAAFVVPTWCMTLAELSAARVRSVRKGIIKKVDDITDVRLGALLGVMCKGCGLSSHEYKKCGRCAQVYYCSKECQRSHWSLHKKECKDVDSTSSVTDDVFKVAV